MLKRLFTTYNANFIAFFIGNVYNKIMDNFDKQKKYLSHKKLKKKFQIDIKNMGIDIDKNEYREIVLSNTNHPEKGI